MFVRESKVGYELRLFYICRHLLRLGVFEMRSAILSSRSIPTLLNPKSVNLMCPLALRRMLSGFKSKKIKVKFIMIVSEKNTILPHFMVVICSIGLSGPKLAH